MKILFVDGAPEKGYTSESLHKNERIGGTEISLIRVAELLATQHSIAIAQYSRCQATEVNQIQYLTYDAAKKLNGIAAPDVIVVIRPRREVSKFAGLYPKAKIFYWMHDIPGKRLWRYKHVFARYHCAIIAVSSFQKSLIKQIWHGNFIKRCLDRLVRVKTPEIFVIYNPVPNYPRDHTITPDPQKLLSVSAGDRGLEQIIMKFKLAKLQLPQLKLYIAHPGYACLDRFKDLLQDRDIISLGSLAPHELRQHIQEALCIFYPQTKKPECFGLVYAEANSLGTPVLAHDFGAATEVLSDPMQLIDGDDIQAIIAKLQLWQNGFRPVIATRKELQSDTIMANWQDLMQPI